MKRTLKRESKVREIAEREPFGDNIVCTIHLVRKLVRVLCVYTLTWVVLERNIVGHVAACSVIV